MPTTAPGLTYAAWKSVGVSLPRSSRSQYGVGSYVAKSDLQLGDLVFFYSPISHVGALRRQRHDPPRAAPGQSRPVHQDELHAVRGRQAPRLIVRPVALVRLVGLLVLSAALVLTAACTVAPPSTPSVSTRPPATPDGRLGSARAAVDALADAARSADRAAFFELVSDRDPTFASRAQLLYTNLSTLPLAELRLRPEPGERPLPPARQQLLGPEAWVQPVLVTWRLVGESDAALHRVWLTFVADGAGARLAGTFDGPVPARPNRSRAGGWDR